MTKEEIEDAIVFLAYLRETGWSFRNVRHIDVAIEALNYCEYNAPFGKEKDHDKSND